MSSPDAEFPKYLMKINGNLVFMNFRDAYVAYNSGMHRVKFGRYILNANWTVRKMTPADKAKISATAEQYDANK